MNHNPQSSSSEGRADEDSALSDFLASLIDYTPTIPDELVEHYLAKSGFQCPDVRLTRLVAVATQKFVAEVAGDALQIHTQQNSMVFFWTIALYVARVQDKVLGTAKQGKQQFQKTKGTSNRRISA